MKIDIKNIDDLNQFLGNLNGAAVSKTILQSNKQIATRLSDLSKQSFLTAKDQYGQSWAPLKSRKGQILRDTGRLFNSISSSSGTHYIRVFVEGDLDYADTHNSGFVEGNIPRRNFIPDKGLPEKWKKYIVERTIKNLQKLILK